MNAGLFVIVLQVYETLFNIFCQFSLCCSDWVSSIDLSSGLLILPSVISTLLVSPSSEVFISVIALFGSIISIWGFKKITSLLRFFSFFICSKRICRVCN